MNSSEASSTGCEADLFIGERLQQPSPVAVAALVLNIIFNILTFPFTAVLNALVLIAVKTKSRLRTHKSNILLALLASTDFTVGVLIQPSFIAVLVMFLLDEPIGYCVMRVFRTVLVCLVETSLLHLVLISGERYLAMKHPFAYTTIITEARLLIASALVWLLSVILQFPLAVDKTAFFLLKNVFSVLNTKMYSVFSIQCSSSFSAMLQSTVKPADMNSNFRLSKLHKRQGNSFKKIKRPSN